jgi:hypothetical protein
MNGFSSYIFSFWLILVECKILIIKQKALNHLGDSFDDAYIPFISFFGSLTLNYLNT